MMGHTEEQALHIIDCILDDIYGKEAILWEKFKVFYDACDWDVPEMNDRDEAMIKVFILWFYEIEQLDNPILAKRLGFEE